jgi:uncharacterized membrane protein (Fun14 family)
MRPPAAWQYLPWFAVAALSGFGVLALLTIGVLFLAAAGVIAVGCLALRLINRSMTATPAGLAVPLLFLAWQNRQGPGVVCVTTEAYSECTDYWNPWPYVVVAVVFVGLAVVAWALFPTVLRSIVGGAPQVPPAEGEPPVPPVGQP